MGGARAVTPFALSSVMTRRLALGAASLALIIGVVACQPYGGAGGSITPSSQASTAESDGADPATPTEQPAATPTASMGSDYGY